MLLFRFTFNYRLIKCSNEGQKIKFPPPVASFMVNEMPPTGIKCLCPLTHANIDTWAHTRRQRNATNNVWKMAPTIYVHVQSERAMQWWHTIDVSIRNIPTTAN